MPSHETKLTIENLSKTYANGVRALRGIDLSIPRGLFGLLGPNGAGKSSLMRTLATLQGADRGSVRLGGIDVLGEPRAVRKILGYLPQDFGVYPRVRAETLLDHFAGLKGFDDRRERRAAVERLLRLTNLWQVRRRRLGTFSGGMRQRFGIAQALLGRPELIIVDEPTTGLDPEERRRFLNLLSRIGEEAIVILSTHLVADVRELCGAMAVIDQGEVLVTGRPEELVSELEGRVWTRGVEVGDLEGLAPTATLLSTQLSGGRTLARVLCPTCPAESFERVPPNLEDVYFRALARHRGGEGRGAVAA